MKTLILLAGILLIAGGCYFVYDGYQLKQTAGAQIEKEVLSVVKALTDNSVKTKTNVNNESAMKMIGGGVAGITGILLLAGGLRRKKS
jgi:heterodisulfide reductase subunit A-like polyferredoxin